MMHRVDLEKARDQFMQLRQAGADDQVAPIFYDQVAEKFNFGQDFSHQKIAFIVVAHKTQTLPYFLAMLSRMGSIASLISKGSHTEEAISQTISNLYSPILSKTLTKDQLENDPEKTNQFFSDLFSRTVYIDYQFVLIDHGGYFAPRLNDTLLKYTNRILGCVEHTLNGQIDYEKAIYILRHQKPDSALPFFIASVAKNELKVLSDELIGCSIVDALRGEVFSGKTTHQDLNRLSHIAILGYGHLGKSVARYLWPDRHIKLTQQVENQAMSLKFSICDTQDNALKEAKKNHPGALITKDKNLIVQDADLIVVATSQRSLTREDFISLKPGAFITCVTSSDKLFESDALVDYERISSNASFNSQAVAVYQHKGTGKKINLVANGGSANFLIGATPHPILHGIFALVGILANAEITKRIHSKKNSKSMELLSAEDTNALKEIWEKNYGLFEHSKTQEKINKILNEHMNFSQFLHYSEEHGLEFQRPPKNHMFVERNDLMKKICDYFFYNHSSTSTFAIVGLGGMGKTQLATRYFYDQEKKYVLRFWFYADSYENLMLQYVKLGEAIQQQGHLKNSVFFSENDSVETKTQKVKHWLEKQSNCLIVYDNVQKPEIIELILPEKGDHHILITSRNEKCWVNICRVDEMEESEAVLLLTKASDKAQTHEANILVNILGCLPLAVMQAGTYIKNYSMNINEYIKSYRDQQVKYLNNDEFLPNLLSNIENKRIKLTPVWLTFDMNLRELEVTCPNALLTLRSASFLASSGIPEFLLKIMHLETDIKSQVDWNKIKAALTKYSFVKIDAETKQWRMHSLLQDIVRYKLLPIEKNSIFKIVCKHVDSLMIQYNCNCSQFNTILLTHAERLNDHGQILAQLPEEEASDVLPQLLAIEPSYLGTYYQKLGLYEKALPFLIQSFALTEKYYGENSVNLLGPLCQLSSVHKEYGEYFESLQLLKRALSIAINIYGVDHIELYSILIGLGDPRLHSSREETKTYLERVLSITEKHYGPYHGRMVPILMNLAATSDDDRSVFKKELLERALAICLMYNDDIGSARILHNLALIDIENGELEKSTDKLERVLEIKKRYFGPNHKEVAMTLAALSSAYGEMKNYKKEIELLEGSLAIIDNYSGPCDGEMAMVFSSLAQAYINFNNDYDRAKPLAEKALLIQKEISGPNYSNLVKSLYLLASIYSDLKKHEEVVQLLNDSIKIIENHCKIENEFLGHHYDLLGRSYQILNHIDLAISSHKQAQRIFRKDLPKTEKALINTENMLQFLYNITNSFSANKSKILDKSGNNTNFSEYASLYQKRKFSTYSRDNTSFLHKKYSIARHATLFSLPVKEARNKFSSLNKDIGYLPIRIFSTSPFYTTIRRYLSPLLKHM